MKLTLLRLAMTQGEKDRGLIFATKQSGGRDEINTPSASNDTRGEK